MITNLVSWPAWFTSTAERRLRTDPEDAHPMDVMRTGCSMLGNLEQESDFSEQLPATERMLRFSLPYLLLVPL